MYSSKLGFNEDSVIVASLTTNDHQKDKRGRYNGVAQTGTFLVTLSTVSRSGGLEDSSFWIIILSV